MKTKSGDFKVLKNDPNHPLDLQDHSLREAVCELGGQQIKYPPSDARSKPVREAMAKKFDRASRLDWSDVLVFLEQ